LLSIASPIFNQILAQSTPPSVVTLSGTTAAALDKILRYLYPIVPKPSLKGVEEAASLLKIARRYQIVAVESHIIADMTISLAAEPNPLRAWAGAITCGADVARKAAMMRFLQVEDPDYDSVKSGAYSALEHVTAQHFYDLEMWRFAAIQEARKSIKAMTVLDNWERLIYPIVIRCIDEVNPFLHLGVFLAAYARVSGQSQSRSAISLQSPEGRKRLISRMQAEVQNVLSLIQSRKPYLDEGPAKAETAPR